MDHYSILGISHTANETDIKKAYRKLALQYHPDKNGGDSAAEEMFKKISDAYSILGDRKKREQYDIQINHSKAKPNFGFEDFVNGWKNSDFRKKNSDWARKTQGKTHAPPPTSDHLNIMIGDQINLGEAITGKKLNLSFQRNKINYTGKIGNRLSYTTDIEEKEINITIDLRKKYTVIKQDNGSYLIRARVPKLGHEEVKERLDIWGELEQIPLIGDLIVSLEIVIPEGIELVGNSIIQWVEIPLSKVIFSGEKIKIETISNKKYEADFNGPSTASNLKFSIPGEGILNDKNELGDYLVKFNVTLPHFENLDSETLANLKETITQLENKS